MFAILTLAHAPTFLRIIYKHVTVVFSVKGEPYTLINSKVSSFLQLYIDFKATLGRGAGPKE